MKNQNQNRTIDYFSLGHPLTRFRSYFSLRARQNMYNFFKQSIKPTPEYKVLDLGVTPDQSLIESNFFENLYPYKDKITAASIEEAYFLEELYPGLQFVKTEPGKPLPFDDNHFDVLFCSAVIEHVGNRESQKAFISECLRVTQHFFFTTPNRQFPIDFHTFIPLIHWLPQRIHQAVLNKLGLDFWAKTDNLNLFTPKALLDMFPSNAEVSLYKYRLLGWPSNLVAYGKKTT